MQRGTRRQSGDDPVQRLAARHLRYRRRVNFYPTHAVIWAAHCARLPRMQPESVAVKLVRPPTDEAGAASVVRLPVAPIPLPCPAQFETLEVYLYSRHKGVFVKAILAHPLLQAPDLLPIVSAMDRFEVAPVVRSLIKRYRTVDDLLRVASGVFGCYHNMMVLGVVDDGAWASVNYAWQVVLAAIEMLETVGADVDIPDVPAAAQA